MKPLTWFRTFLTRKERKPKPVTPEDVDRIAGDDLYLRHLLFIRFVLREPLTDAGLMAIRAAREGMSLSVEDMRYVAAHYHESDEEHVRCEPVNAQAARTALEGDR